MSNHIDFYFDIISPYAFIAYKNIIKIEHTKFTYRPILLGGLHNLNDLVPKKFYYLQQMWVLQKFLF